MLFITRHYCGLILECPLPKASSCARDRICGSQMDYGDTTTDLLVGGRARLKENHWWHYLEVYIFHSGSFLLSLLPSCHDVSSFPLTGLFFISFLSGNPSIIRTIIISPNKPILLKTVSGILFKR